MYVHIYVKLYMGISHKIMNYLNTPPMNLKSTRPDGIPVSYIAELQLESYGVHDTHDVLHTGLVRVPDHTQTHYKYVRT